MGSRNATARAGAGIPSGQRDKDTEMWQQQQRRQHDASHAYSRARWYLRQPYQYGTHASAVPSGASAGMDRSPTNMFQSRPRRTICLCPPSSPSAPPPAPLAQPSSSPRHRPWQRCHHCHQRQQRAMPHGYFRDTSIRRRRRTTRISLCIAALTCGIIAYFASVWHLASLSALTSMAGGTSANSNVSISAVTNTKDQEMGQISRHQQGWNPISHSLSRFSSEATKPAAPWQHDACDRYRMREHSPDPIAQQIYTQWNYINQTLQAHNTDRFSGGIFLYPRQASLLLAMIQHQQPRTICETGFGSGHSMALFVAAHAGASIYSFDKFDRPYQLDIWRHLRRDDLSTHVAGDSCRTVPQRLPAHCEFVHGSSLCPTDVMDLVKYSGGGTIVTATAMASLHDGEVYFAPLDKPKTKKNKLPQWELLMQQGCLRDVTCFEEEAIVLDRSFFYAKKGARMSHYFCIGITTGTCSVLGDMKHSTSHERIGPLADLCPQYQVNVPTVL